LDCDWSSQKYDQSLAGIPSSPLAHRYYQLSSDLDEDDGSNFKSVLNPHNLPQQINTCHTKTPIELIDGKTGIKLAN
jgi:hypothetical protein